MTKKLNVNLYRLLIYVVKKSTIHKYNYNLYFHMPIDPIVNL